MCVYVGVNLVERSKSRQILKQFTLRELDRWGYKPNVLFYFEVKLDQKEPTSIEFGTKDGLKMANLLTDYAHALIQEAELQKVRRMSLHAQQDLEIEERNQMRLSSKNSTRETTSAPPPPPPPPPPPSKRNSLPNGVAIVSDEKSVRQRAFSAAETPPPPPPPQKPTVPAGSLAPQPLPGMGSLQPGSRNSTRGSPSAPPPPPPPPKASSRPPSQRVTSTKLHFTPHQHQCAIIIQSNYRGYAFRSAWIREDSAILIQAFYRGYAERCRVAAMLEELYRSGQLELLDEEER